MRIVLLTAAALAPLTLCGQPANDTPAFEVVSVKPSTREGHYGIGIFPFAGGRVEASSCPVEYLIQEAFNIQPFQIAGAPRWTREEFFDLMGKPPEASPLSKYQPQSHKSPLVAEQRQMLQAALVDQFRLQYHWETREGPVYLLVKTGKELNMTRAKETGDFHWAGSVASGAPFSDGIAGENETMANLAERISPILGHMVIDQTGIEGVYDFKAPYPGDDRSDIGAVIIACLPQLGLKLQPSRGPVKTLVVDRVERPSAN
jgi:uncharacterized protein (TIGR03435 family)